MGTRFNIIPHKDLSERPLLLKNKDRDFHHVLGMNEKSKLTVLIDLPKEKRQIFSDLVYALEERFAPPCQTELHWVQFKKCRQKASDTLPGLGQSVRRLSNLAYPTAPLELRDTLAKEQFIDALVDSEMRLRIKQSRPKGLNNAIRLAVELEAYNTTESKTLKGMGHVRQSTCLERTDAPNSPVTAVSMGQMTTWMQTIENNLLAITKEIKDLKSQRKGTHKNDFNTDGTIKTLKSEVKSSSNDKDAVVVSPSENAGMSFQDVPVKFVVDTRATLTLVSTRVYNLIPDLCKPHLSATSSQIKSVCDNYLSLGGKGCFSLDFDKEKFTSEAVVTDLLVDGILGLDFMKKNKCLIDVKPCRLTSESQSKTDHDCSRRKQSKVNIVTSKMPDKGKDLSLIELQSNDSDL
ncbi:unnamed protein product [Mytilus edulis]|uniref:Uncharacterized protein n=1 Tax=Mytilus edulis TaxID=6550 RepID=A0A8S3S3N4_MYTED|nr:unnamed protein product [Mytilus edulis]